MNYLFSENYFTEMFGRYLVDFSATLILVRLIYYPLNKRKEYVFTYFLFNTLIFFLCFLMGVSANSVGLGFGLFAVFSILRYRTETVPVKEMAYLFVVITLAVIDSIGDAKIGIEGLIGSNVLILGLTYLLERYTWKNLTNENVKDILYERIDLITPEKHEEMIKDLQTRTGLPIHRFDIIKIDFLRDVAAIKAYYMARGEEGDSNKK